jgi:hypothetical protein
VTDRARVALLPDETPVEELPLRRATIIALRSGGVPTLGGLRTMADHELLELRRFGLGALADVRSLVPAPAAGVGDEVTIAGRAFRLATVYAPRRGMYGYAPRRLLAYVADGPLPGGRVTVAVLPSGKERVVAGAVWAAWAGEPVGDRLTDEGRR